jgi:hypothetical protein
MLKKKAGDIPSITITEEDERLLLDPDDLDAGSPEYFTESFSLFNQLLDQALLEPSDIQQIETYLQGLAQADDTFQWRKAKCENGSVVGIVWQTGVMKRDFELYGSTLFLDRLGRSLNSKGWPLMTVAMLSGEKMVCLACEGIAVEESLKCYAWFLEAAVDMTPGVELSDIRVIYGDGIFAGDNLPEYLGISGTCRIVFGPSPPAQCKNRCMAKDVWIRPMENPTQGGLHRTGEVL